MKRVPAKSHKNVIILNKLLLIFCKLRVLVIYRFMLPRGFWFVILTGTLRSSKIKHW